MLQVLPQELPVDRAFCPPGMPLDILPGRPDMPVGVLPDWQGQPEELPVLFPPSLPEEEMEQSKDGLNA